MGDLGIGECIGVPMQMQLFISHVIWSVGVCILT